MFAVICTSALHFFPAMSFLFFAHKYYFIAVQFAAPIYTMAQERRNRLNYTHMRDGSRKKKQARYTNMSNGSRRKKQARYTKTMNGSRTKR